jgi:hypothetical protein
MVSQTNKNRLKALEKLVLAAAPKVRIQGGAKKAEFEQYQPVFVPPDPSHPDAPPSWASSADVNSVGAGTTRLPGGVVVVEGRRNRHDWSQADINALVKEQAKGQRKL